MRADRAEHAGIARALSAMKLSVVSNGSLASLLSTLPHVRYSPISNRTADIQKPTLSAKSRHVVQNATPPLLGS
jgi:hypothetical protein